jgi:hypothetical protein
MSSMRKAVVSKPPPHHSSMASCSALAAAGISKDEAHRCEQIARFGDGAFERYIAAKKAAGPASVTRPLD